MIKIRFVVVATIFMVLLWTFASFAQGEASRTFVSSNGHDNNPCGSFDKPCRTISTALSKVQAGGEVVILDSGNYQPFVVDKAVSVVAAPGANPGMTVAAGPGIFVSAGADDVVLIRGLRIISDGGARGIHFQSGRALQVEDCLISGFTPLPDDCCTDGILVTASSSVVVKSTTVRANFNGIRIFSAPSALIEHSSIDNNSNGLWVEDDGRATIRNSLVTRNGSGITSFINAGSPDSGPSEINVENCVVTGNSDGIVSTGKVGDSITIWTLVRVSNTTVTHNGQGLVIQTPGSGRLYTRENNTVEGNDVDGSFSDIFAAM